MGRLKIAAIAGVALVLGAGGAVGATALFDGEDQDRTIAPVAAQSATATTGNTTPTRVIVDDGVPVEKAEAIAQAAAEHQKGRALTVDSDDGRYEVEVLRPNGDVVEVVLDGTSVVGVQPADIDG